MSEREPRVDSKGRPYEDLVLEVSAPVVKILSDLVDSGLHGHTIEETAERLLCEAIQERIDRGSWIVRHS